jgi:hypothetical protein
MSSRRRSWNKNLRGCNKKRIHRRKAFRIWHREGYESNIFFVVLSEAKFMMKKN